MAEFRFSTDRLVLREWHDGDRAPFADMNRDPEVMRYFRSTLTREQSDALVDRIEDHFRQRGFGLFALERKEDGAFLGFTGFSAAPANTPVSGEIEIGWRIARQFWRKGYAYEAAAACVDWFWSNTTYQRLVSFTADQNLISQGLMRKLGFEHRPELDFDHPAFTSGEPLRRQVVFVLDRNA